MSKQQKTHRFVQSRRLLLSGAVASIASQLFPVRVLADSFKYEFTGPAADRNLNIELPLKCTSGTRSQTPGPFYTPSTPLRQDLREPQTKAENLVIEGFVLTEDCHPVAGAVVDIWHCDDSGRYDNSGYRYRGHQFTDSAGRYHFKTIRPGKYTGRTEHIHVTVQGPQTTVLTTQLYFPDKAKHNARDWIFKEDLLIDLEQQSDGWRGRFDFVVQSDTSS